MLSATIESSDNLANLQFPVWVSKKYDGIRAITTGSGVVSRTLKPIPNKFIQSSLSGLPAGIEGELCKLANNGNLLPFEDTDSAVMSEEGKFKFGFFAFDWFSGNRFEPYFERHKRLKRFPSHPFFKVIDQAPAKTTNQIEAWLEAEVELNHGEGIMIRSPDGFYKFGRSTLNEQLLIKYKYWNTDEAVVLDVLEEFENTNPSLSDERGYSKRSKHGANLKGKNTMGALLVESEKFGEFKLGSGWTEKEKRVAWETFKRFNVSKSSLPKGNTLQYRYRGLTKYGKPKHASFLKWV